MNASKVKFFLLYGCRVRMVRKVRKVMHCALCIVHCSLCIVHCALFIVHCSLCIVHCASLPLILFSHLLICTLTNLLIIFCIFALLIFSQKNKLKY